MRIILHFVPFRKVQMGGLVAPGARVVALSLDQREKPGPYSLGGSHLFSLSLTHVTGVPIEVFVDFARAQKGCGVQLPPWSGYGIIALGSATLQLACQSIEFSVTAMGGGKDATPKAI